MEEVWRAVLDTVAAEFSDLPDVEQVTRIALRLLVAALLGGLLGYERERHGKAAGVRTHMLVALGAALFVLVPQQAGVSSADLTRVTQGLITGIGFLGAGAIIKGSEDENVQGLTTAAGIWMTAAIGVAAGMGREATALLSTLLALGVLAVVPRLGPNEAAVQAAAARRQGNGAADDAPAAGGRIAPSPPGAGSAAGSADDTATAETPGQPTGSGNHHKHDKKAPHA